MKSTTVDNSTYLQRLTISLAIPAYRWIWLNSVFGTMRLITVFVVRGWLVLTITDSPFWVGAAPALRGLTQILLGSLAGVLLDRVNRRLALLIAEFCTSLIALTLGFLVLFGQIELWHILVASIFEGAFVSIRWPAINTMIFQTVGPHRVLNASAAQMLGFNAGNIVASGIAGMLVAAFGIGSGYLFAASCGFIATGCILMVQGNFRPTMEQKEQVLQAISRGFAYIRNNRALFPLIILAFLMSLLGWSNLSMLPVVARDVLHVDASGLGFLTADGALGSLISTAIIAGWGDFKDKTRLILLSGLCTTIAILLFSLSSSYLLSLFLMLLMQGALMAFEVTITAMVLLVTADQMQGRVQGIYTQVFGFTWVGGIVLGSIAEVMGAPLAIALGGAAIGMAILLMYGRIREVEEQEL
ncbi:MFS transporter [Chloroflexi bacterium TSY]|nr:MFS transporter [Chloroflexi bacterium TSY]